MRIDTPTKAKNFLFAGHAKFTIVSARTGTRFTYKLDKKKDDDIYFLKVLCAPDVWKFVGSLYPQSKAEYRYIHSSKAQVCEDAASVKAFKWFLVHLQSVETFHSQLELWHEGKCGKCGRSLTVPESISTGLGPECAATMGIQWIVREREAV